MVYISFGRLPLALGLDNGGFERVRQHPVAVAFDAANVGLEALELPQRPAVHVAFGEDHVAGVDQGLDEDVVRLA